MASTLELLRRLTNEKTEFVLVGGMAAIAHGCSIATEDVDVCLRFDAVTLERVWRALKDLDPRERMHHARPPLGADFTPYIGYRNLYLTTTTGVVNLLSTIVGVGDYDQVSQGALDLDLGGFRCRVMSLERLLICKRTLARPKDLRVVGELEVILEKLRG